MKLDCDGVQDRTNTAIVLEKVHAFFGAADACEIDHRTSATAQGNSFVYEAVLVEIDEIGNKDWLIELPFQLAPIFASHASRVFLRAQLKDSFLKPPI
ncbi:hypothetical protein D3C84_761890 [compost metagenome]